MMTDKNLEEAKRMIKTHLIEASYRLFIEPLKYIATENNEIILQTNSELGKFVVDERFKDIIQFTLEELLDEKVLVKIVVSKF